ncbi:MAG TPA: OB-fold domain-containing protein [Halococcus sp.]|nr:OB-fold domain-containing protein [Halococcus sp.]
MSDANEGFDDFLDAVSAGEAYYLECAEGHGWLPPRRICPECGSRDLTEQPLPESGTIKTHTTVRVPAPSFEEDAPYTTAIADFGPLRVTAQIDDPDEVETGLTVGLDIGESMTTGERVLVFQPR